MSRLNCAEAEQLLGARALDALPIEDTELVDEHVQHCAEHREVLAQLRRTAGRLPLAVEDREPPAELRQRILDAVRGESPDTAPAAPTTLAERRLHLAGGRLWRRAVPRPRQLAIAASILLALALGFAAGSRIAQPPLQSRTFAGGRLAPTARAILVYLPGQSSAVLTLTGLPPLASGQVYEAWLVRDGVPVDVGVSTAAGGQVALRIDRDVTRYRTVAVTIEPGEQPKPTTPPVLAGNLD